MEINGKDRPAIDLILGVKGPRLSAAGREWLTEITRRSMSLYEVREVKKGQGLLLQDLVYTEEKPVWVHEKSATEFLVQWDVFGARLASNEGKMVLTGAVYPMERPQALACLEEIAGAAVAYKIREVVDPRSQKADKSAKPASSSDIPADVQHQLIHDYLRKHYESWPMIPLPVLGGKTSLQAVKSKKGREGVVELLKSIEQLEQRRPAETGCEPFDIGFLWERLGLKRETAL